MTPEEQESRKEFRQKRRKEQEGYFRGKIIINEKLHKEQTICQNLKNEYHQRKLRITYLRNSLAFMQQNPKMSNVLDYEINNMYQLYPL